MKNSGLDKILGRIDDLDSVNLGILVQRLARDRKLQETVFNTIQDGILVIDSEGVVQYANEAAFSLIGLKEDDIGNTRLWKMVPDLARSIDLNKDEDVAKASPVLSREVELTYPEHRFDEDSPYNPYQNYGRSKMEMELRARDYAAELGMELVIIRPPWFYGPFQPPRQTLFFSMIKNGKGPLVGSGLNQRSMVYLDNLCQGLALAGRLPQAAGNTYWIADAEPYEMRTILDTIENVLEQDFAMEVAHKRMQLPSLVGDIAYWVDSAVQATGFYHQKFHVLSEMNKNIACSIDKARRELGYEPKIALREGMRRSIRWCLDQGMSI